MLYNVLKPLAGRYPGRGLLNRDAGLKRSLGPWSLTAMGIGAIIGTGIFVLTGVASATRAGPSLTISFIVAGFVSALAALCYAEVSSKIPISGSAYTYTYATLGELMAWIIGWDLVLEYALGAATVSIGWSGYFVNILHQTGISLAQHSAGVGQRAALGRSPAKAGVHGLREPSRRRHHLDRHRAACKEARKNRVGERGHRRDQTL